MGADYNLAPKATEFHVDALDQAAPVQNDYYPISDRLNVKVWDIQVRVAAVGETLQLRVTIDGVVYVSAGFAAVANTTYAYTWRRGAELGATFVLTNTVTEHGFGELLEGRDVLIEVRKTTNNGAGNLQGRVMIGQY